METRKLGNSNLEVSGQSMMTTPSVLSGGSTSELSLAFHNRIREGLPVIRKERVFQFLGPQRAPSVSAERRSRLSLRFAKTPPCLRFSKDRPHR
jgi:hypothetical protein